MITDFEYPKIDIAFLIDEIERCNKVIPNSKISVGSTTIFTIEGKRPLSQRTIVLVEIGNNEVNYFQATGLAIKLSFIGSLMDWLMKNKNWKEGAYIVTENPK